MFRHLKAALSRIFNLFFLCPPSPILQLLSVPNQCLFAPNSPLCTFNFAILAAPEPHSPRHHLLIVGSDVTSLPSLAQYATGEYFGEDKNLTGHAWRLKFLQWRKNRIEDHRHRMRVKKYHKVSSNLPNELW
ncbi:Hypothetical predicted protein [Pelobates cultripes]|uniref:Uncharacterized protein n=1 Tax=Pelobates cultripes TaxID=61616 RepID=A0AAD1TJU1_PELCU|nr:Hypothetical predicted protein [Pelobates cultripes]